MAKLTTPEKANRLARAIASDIAAYNEAAIVRALADDNFFDAMNLSLKLYRLWLSTHLVFFWVSQKVHISIVIFF